MSDPVEDQPAADPAAEETPPADPPADAEGGDAPAEGGEAPAEGEGPPADGEAAEGEGDGKSEIAKRIEKDPLELELLETELPENVTFDTIPKINDARGVWRLGMRKIEETFAEHIANMHLDFEDKALQYEKIEGQLQVNHQFLLDWYVKMQNHLNEKYASIKIEKDAWELEKEEIKKIYKYDSEIVSLNIGGTTHIQTEKDVLCSVEGSTLAKLFSDMHELKKVNDEVFLDRDGVTFETLVNYLRNERKVFPEFGDKNSENMFYKEMHYWGIVCSVCKNAKDSKDFPKDFIKQISLELEDSSQIANTCGVCLSNLKNY